MYNRIKQYKITDRLAEIGSTLVCRGRRTGNGEPVVLKILKTDVATRDEVARFRREFEITSKLNLPGVVKVRGLEEYRGGLMMVMEDIGGQSLDRILDQAPLSLTESLELAVALAETVGLMHRQRIIHKNINPSNIIWNSQTKQLNLIDFGLADEMPMRSVTPQPPAGLEGTLEYISPEQTGRMNRYVDYRTDFYSLGVTFYRMLTRKLPFEADDALGLVYCHIAKIPIPPNVLNPDIPETVSLIVMKLMAKMADDRYLSAWGLKTDLERCLRELADKGIIVTFELASGDSSDQLRIPQKLYGREKEMAQLLEAFERVSAGAIELLLVTGYAGIGKTALVKEIQRPTAEKRGYFITGKFDQLQRNVPYFSWIQAFTGFVNHLLMESEAQLTRWKQIILGSVRGIGRVLTDVIPNLELVIGTQPAIPELGAAEAQNRFNYVFLKFVKAIATSEHPLVIFLDDLQWIDGASLSLLQTLMSSIGVSHILIIGAYRDNEVDALHPLTKSLVVLRKEQARIDQMTLQDFSEETANELLAETLAEERSQTFPLTRLIYSKTGGNPFFLMQTLAALFKRQAISFDPERRCWQWDIAAIVGMEITDNVAALMLGKIRQLPRETQDLLPLAACIGFHFDVTTLCAVAERSAESILNGLQPALGEGVMVADAEHRYRFVHDRVLEAAYTLLPEEERPAVHWRIGQRLLREIAPAERKAHLFEIVNQLNIGASCLATPEEAKVLADLNRQAGRKAKASAAFLAALEYFEAGLSSIDDNDWETAYELTIALHIEAAEAACLCGRYERMEALVFLVQQRARAILDALPVYGTEIRALTARGRLVPAIRSGLRALERLGMHLQEEPSAAEVNEAMARAFALLQQRTIEGLIDLPPMTSPEQLASLSLLSEIGEPAYAASPHFFLVWASSMAELSLRHGNCPLSPFAYAAYALALCATGKIETGSCLSKAAIAMIDVLKAHSLSCRLLNIHGCTIQPWTEHLRDTLPTLTEAVGAGAESGDFTSASYAAFNSCTAAFFMGEPLEELGVRVSTNLKIIAGLRQTYIWNWVAFHVPIIRRLHGGENCPATVEDFDEASWLSAARDSNDRCGLAYYFLSRLIAAYLLNGGEIAEALAHIAEIKENMAGFQGAFAVPVFSFYCSLTLLKRHRMPQTEKDATSLEEVRAHLAKLEALAQYAPMNFRHKCDLIAAELARIQGEDWRAAGHYEKAIVGAKDNGFFQEEALANELAAKFYLAHGRKEYARMHLNKAHQGYGLWQAFAKVRALEAEYPQWLKRLDSQQPALETHSLDMESILKATHTISGEIEMGRVLGKIMHIVIENAGAQIGFLLMESNGVWTVAARGEIGKNDVEIPIPEAVDDNHAVSAGVIRFVARTRKTVVLDDAATRGAFVDDPHIRREKTRSLLATPLCNRGRLLGILYLVNNLATHTFTQKRIQLLEILAAQAAISLETAGAYEALRLNELRYRLGQTAAHIGTWEYDLQTDRFWGSDEAKRIYGFDPDAVDFSTENVESCIPERQRVRQALLDLIDRGAPYNLEFEIRPENGSAPKFISSIAELHRDLHGKPKKVVGVIQDITEHKRAEEALKTSEERFRRLAENARDIIYRMSLPSGTYEYMSPAVTELFGYAPEEFYESPLLIRKVIHPDWHGYFEEQWSRLMWGEMPSTYEYPIVRKSGEIRWMNQRNILIRDKEDHIIAIEGIVTDITERRKSEEAHHKLNTELEERIRERTAELERKNAELEQMNKLFIGRELRMIELKDKIAKLEGKAIQEKTES